MSETKNSKYNITLSGSVNTEKAIEIVVREGSAAKVLDPKEQNKTLDLADQYQKKNKVSFDKLLEDLNDFAVSILDKEIEKKKESYRGMSIIYKK